MCSGGVHRVVATLGIVHLHVLADLDLVVVALHDLFRLVHHPGGCRGGDCGGGRRALVEDQVGVRGDARRPVRYPLPGGPWREGDGRVVGGGQGADTPGARMLNNKHTVPM